MPKDCIALNFLPVTSDSFSFPVYRKPDSGETKASFPSHVRKKSLPVHEDVEERAFYWVSLTELVSFDKYQCKDVYNQFVTRDFLHNRLLASCEVLEESVTFSEEVSFAGKRVCITLKSHEEGDETIWLQSYYLKSALRFGFLIDFHFRKSEGVPFTRHIQQLSLSLDSRGRENRNYYADRYDVVHKFINGTCKKLFPLSIEGEYLGISDKLFTLDANALDNKSYVFFKGKTDASQFLGIRRYHPFSGIGTVPTVFFLYRQQDRALSLDLYKALKGQTFPNVFPGTEIMFEFPLTPDNVKGIVVSDFRQDEMQRVKDTVLSKPYEGPVLVMLIAPWNEEEEEDSQDYFRAKHIFVSAQIPSQVVRLHTLQQEVRLKWSASNIALQAFAKLGGKPWTVDPRHSRCLIIGIGQAHIEQYTDGKRHIVKFYAYSVLTDSSGVFKELRVLGRSEKANEYLTQLKGSIFKIVKEYSSSYDRFVIHAPYKIRRDELDSIKEIIEGYGEEDSPEFVVLKINTNNEFFGWSKSNNSLVPFESTYTALANDEFLVWFEGLQYHNPKVARRYAHPIHIAFHYANTYLSDTDKRDYLQDAVNLSGANWRGFNAKNIPVSIYYAQLIARFTSHFEDLGLQEVAVNNLNPWFL